MATITKTIGTSSRDYSTWTAWEAADGGATGSDDAVGEGYNDSAFNEPVTINATVPLSMTITVAAGERHDGTAGTGARIIKTSGDFVISNSAPGSSTTIEWLDLSNTTNSSSNKTFFGANGSDTYQCTYKNLLIHGFEKSAGTSLMLAIGGNGRWDLLNTIIYDFNTNTGSNATLIGISAQATSGNRYVNILNNTVYNLIADGATTVDCQGMNITNTAKKVVKNCISMDITALNTTGSVEDYFFAGTVIGSETNLSSDDTADDAGGSGHLLSKSSADQFVSTVGGSEDLHLKSGADAIDVGTDLVTTPTGVEIDINGRDRDFANDIWDIGAHEFVAALVNPIVLPKAKWRI